MTSSSPLNFTNRDLRNRSFKGQNLNGADFSGCDIRGCDFSYALLQNANFERVSAGQTPRQFVTLVGVAAIVALLAADAFSQMIFGALGRTAAEPGWSFILALGISLAIAGAFAPAKVLLGNKSLAGRLASAVSGAASGALLGFFYAGSTTNNNPQIATIGAVLGGLVMAMAIFRWNRGGLAVAVAVAGAIAGYGFAFLIGATAIAFFSSQRWIMAAVWGTVSVSYMWLTLNSLALAVREMRSIGMTSFRGADLTNAKFDGVRLQNADFSGAIGYAVSGD
jgi:hypothetical protein